METEWPRYCAMCERGFMPEGNELVCERCRKNA